ncbi:16109_t:CDS:2, partial [Gigaspora margarita]
MSDMKPSVVRLLCYLPNHHIVNFSESTNLAEFLSNEDNKKTILTEYFYLNATDLEAQAERSLHECMFEAKQFRSLYALCNLFLTILVFREPTDVREIWNQNFDAMSKDFIKNSIPRGQLYINAQHDKNIDYYNLPRITNLINKELPKLILEELSIPVLSKDLDKIKLLNRDQKIAFDSIIQRIDKNELDSTNALSRYQITLYSKKKQFPIRLAFALTINKSRGQTISHVSLYLPKHIFTHGQLYVAFSRVKSAKNLKVLVKNRDVLGKQGTYTSFVKPTRLKLLSIHQSITETSEETSQNFSKFPTTNNSVDEFYSNFSLPDPCPLKHTKNDKINEYTEELSDNDNTDTELDTKKSNNKIKP